MSPYFSWGMDVGWWGLVWQVISGRLYSGPEVDVWGCGVVLFTLLCGRLPFDEKSHVALYQKIKAGAYTRPTHVTPAVQDLLARMLVVDPLQRISIPEIRQHPWFLPWFLPTQLLQYQKEEEHRRQQGTSPEDGPRTTVQVCTCPCLILLLRIRGLGHTEPPACHAADTYLQWFLGFQWASWR